jgi:hypothetical protein
MYARDFQYPLSFAVIAYLGLAIAPVVSVVFIGVAIELLFVLHQTIAIKLDGVLVLIFGLYVGWLSLLSFRYWYFLVTKYSVDERGVKVEFLSSKNTLFWDTLETARYRRAMGFLEIKFRNAKHAVVLTPVGTLAERRERVAMLDVIAIIERVTGVVVSRSIL